MTLNVPKELKLKCWDYLQNNNMGNRHSANGNKENQLVGLVGEILTKQIFNIEHKFINGFDGGFDFFIDLRYYFFFFLIMMNVM